MNLRLYISIFFSLLLSSAAFAQKFEGTVTMEITSAKMPAPMTIVVETKDDKMVSNMQMPQGEMKLYFDRKAEKMTMVFGKMGMESDMKKLKEQKKDDDNRPKPTVVATGEKKEINGHSCELYIVTSNDSSKSNWWMTGDLPKSLLNSLHEIYEHSAQSSMAKRTNSPGMAAIREMFEKGLVPIKVEMLKDGKPETTMTFVKYEQKHLDDADFVIPSDVTIQPMPSMGRQ